MILDVETAEPDVDGTTPGHYYVEIQLRTIAMDTWAALEHEMKYKKSIGNQELIIQELRRCANELAACDVSMQTMRRIIREGE
jgi:ppGpp synthetase/RelA/SpoT-type nucleotidyltranferase